MNWRVDALVIGAGPAGAAAAILLARAGWRVLLAEQDGYPRRKVCGECLSAATLAMLDELGIGAGIRAHAGPELRRIGWMSESATIAADFPACNHGAYRYGRVLRRDFLDALLVGHAAAQGVAVLQPARVLAVRGGAGAFQCDVESASASRTIHSIVVIDAHGSWQRGPRAGTEGCPQGRRIRRPRDLFAFKAVFEATRLEPGLLPVIALHGGYGGIVVADQGLATLACCLRRDALSACRRTHRGPAGEAVEALLRGRCMGVRQALDGARRLGPWLTVGPLRPGMEQYPDAGMFRVGNAAGESHPLIGEGIGMALQSAALLANELTRQPPAAVTADHARQLQRRYALAWRQACGRRLRTAAIYSQIAMRPWLASPACAMLRRWPVLLTTAARFAGKAREFTPGPPHGAIHHEHP